MVESNITTAARLPLPYCRNKNELTGESTLLGGQSTVLNENSLATQYCLTATTTTPPPAGF